MSTVLVTGSAGLIGSEAVRFFSRQGHAVVGIDNNMRQYFFGEEASTDWSRRQLEEEITDYKHYRADIRDERGIDRSKHSVFGASKVAADVMVQEYGHYFGMKTGVFRGGCLTGGGHSGTELHGFLSYLMRCCIERRPYVVHGYKGKQVRDNIHSEDLIGMFWHFFQRPRAGAVHNAGGSRHSHCSMLEAIALCEEVSGRKLNWSYSETNRIGDHIWYVSDVRAFRADYPEWSYQYDLRAIVEAIYQGWCNRTQTSRRAA